MKRHVYAKAGAGKYLQYLRTVLPAVVLLLVSVFAALGFLVYKITHPGAVPETVNPSHYLLPSLEVAIPSGRGEETASWWIPGLKGAPGILLAPGYGMSRSDALSLAVMLREKGFNLLVYDQRGCGTSPKGSSTLGLREAGDMLQALEILRNRSEIDASRVGIWGVDVGAYAALRAAASVPEVRAVVADGAFEFVPDFLDFKIFEDFGLKGSPIRLGCGWAFTLLHLGDRSLLSEPLPVELLAGRAVLFIRGENRKLLGDLTAALSDRFRPRQEMASFKTSRVRLMTGEDLKTYDTQVTDFFQLNLR